MIYVTNAYSENAYNKVLKVDTIVLSEENDPYRELAIKISGSENALLINSISQLYEYYPKYLVYVSSPDNLSREKIVDLALYFKKTKLYPATGIITGSNMIIAEKLWNKNPSISEGKEFMASDFDKNAGLDKGIIIETGVQPEISRSLDRNNLLYALENSKYFYWARHVSTNKWMWDNIENKGNIKSPDLPVMNDTIIHSPSCGSFAPWKKDSIALGFIDKGASAYIGNLFSPISSGIFMGNMKYLPGIYTYPDFEIGIMTQIQNKAMHGISTSLPFLLMIGNPKIFLQEKSPYKIIDDYSSSNKRVINGECNTEGIIPIKIKNGAQYSFIKIKNISTIDSNAFYYNAKIQSLNLHDDKYILFINKGGNFTIELTKKTDPLWSLSNLILDAFDHSWITIAVVQDHISIFFLIMFITVFSIYFFKMKKKGKEIFLSLISGIVFSLIQLLFILSREEAVTISSYIRIHSGLKLFLGFIGTFSTVSSGLIMILSSKKLLVKIIGYLFAALPQLIVSLFYIVFITYTDIIFISNKLPPLWNYSFLFLYLIVLFFEILLLFLISISFYNSDRMRLTPRLSKL